MIPMGIVRRMTARFQAVDPTARMPDRPRAPVLRPPKSPESTIEGLPDTEGRAILAELWALAAASPHAYEAVIGPGEMVIWEGTQAAHTNPAFPRATGRRTWFYTVPAAWEELEPYAA